MPNTSQSQQWFERSSKVIPGGVNSPVRAFGSVGGQPAVVIVQDFTFMGGSLGMAAGEAFIKAAREAVAALIAILGDSYSQGTGAPSVARSWAAAAAAQPE